MADDAPAWMLCEDMITRLKDELTLEAIDILHEELKEGRIDISGYVSLLPDKPDEMQKDIYIINNLVQREDEIAEQYQPEIERIGIETDPDKVERAERLGKFMLSVHAISALMGLGEIAGKWAQGIGKYSSYARVGEIISRSMGDDPARGELVDFVLSSSRFARSQALSESELDLFRKARPSIS